jgi:hypothetical protein
MTKPILLFLIIFPFFSFSQDISELSNESYFETMKNKLNIKLEFDNDIESFEFDDGITSYTIKPNINFRTSISVNHDFLTLRVGFSPKFLARDDSKIKGSTKVFKVNMDLFIKNWVQTFEFSTVKGYYLDDIEGIDNINLPDDSDFIILPDLKTTTFRGFTRYKFNDNFSFKAILNQYDIQIKSAGSFVPSLNYGYAKLSDDSSIQDLQSIDIVLNAGYFYTFVINKKWYTNLGISPGLGIEFNKLKTKNADEVINSRNNGLIFNINTLIGLGYNSKSFYSGVFLRGVATTRDDNSIVKFNNVRGVLKFFIGYRFRSPKFVNDGFDWIEDQNPLK